MKFITAFLLTALLSFALSLFFPWWIIAVAAFLVAFLIHQHPFKAFLCGFFSLFFLWAVLSFYLSNANNHMLAHKVSVLLLKQDNPFLLIAATALIGAVVGGFGSLTGALARKIKTA